MTPDIMCSPPRALTNRSTAERCVMARELKRNIYKPHQTTISNRP